MEFSQLVTERRSVKSYDPEYSITDEELISLFEEVTWTPSSFNLQHWFFIAVRDQDLKQKIKQAAWEQQHVEDCSVIFLVCGKLDAYKDGDEVFQNAPQGIKDKMVPMIQSFYQGNDTSIRDEAIRSASLAAMTLMLAAKNKGYGTCPMIGFDPLAVSKLLELKDNTIPVMLLTLGKQKDAPRARDYRRPVEEIVRWNSQEGPGLTN
jgi:putative NAD(P)H nitroreductase